MGKEESFQQMMHQKMGGGQLQIVLYTIRKK